jgi:hypothetical protein
VAELLLNAGQTQRAIAAATGVDHSTVTRDLKARGANRTTSTTSPRQQAATQREENKRSLDPTKAEVRKQAKQLRDLGKPARPSYEELAAEVTWLRARVAELEELVGKLEAERTQRERAGPGWQPGCPSARHPPPAGSTDEGASDQGVVVVSARPGVSSGRGHPFTPGTGLGADDLPAQPQRHQRPAVAQLP